MSPGMRGVLYRAQYRIDPRYGFQTGRGALCASVGGFSLRVVWSARAAGRVCEFASARVDVRRES